MSRPQADQEAGVILALPPIALSELEESTKDFLLAIASTGKPPKQAVKELLDRGAAKAGFTPSIQEMGQQVESFCADITAAKSSTPNTP